MRLADASWSSVGLGRREDPASLGKTRLHEQREHEGENEVVMWRVATAVLEDADARRRDPPRVACQLVAQHGGVGDVRRHVDAAAVELDEGIRYQVLLRDVTPAGGRLGAGDRVAPWTACAELAFQECFDEDPTGQA